jgi:hypothetical protein
VLRNQASPCAALHLLRALPLRGSARAGGFFNAATPLAAANQVPDQVLAWNQHAYNELIIGQGPFWVQHMAMVHGAIYDAVNAIDGGFQPYLIAPAAGQTYSKDAAAATAAHEVLVWLLPGRATQLDGYYNDSLALIPDGPDKQGGIDVGMAAAHAMTAARADDGRPGTSSFTTPSFTVGFGPGDWRPFAEGLPGNNFKWLGDLDPWLVPDSSRFATDGPLPLRSPAYAAEFDQVKSLGAAMGSTRTPDQTAMALFWADNAFAMWTRIFRQLSMSQELSVVENARLFAMLYLTASDADRVLPGQGAVGVLAATDSDSAGRRRRQPRHSGRSELEAAPAEPAVPRPPLGTQLRDLLDRRDAEGLLRDEPDVVQRHARHPWDHPVVHPLFASDRGDPTRPRLRRDPLRDRGRAGGHPGEEGREVSTGALLPAGGLIRTSEWRAAARPSTQDGRTRRSQLTLRVADWARVPL